MNFWIEINNGNNDDDDDGESEKKRTICWPIHDLLTKFHVWQMMMLLFGVFVQKHFQMRKQQNIGIQIKILYAIIQKAMNIKAEPFSVLYRVEQFILDL